MQSLRAFVFTGLSSSFIRSLLTLLVFVTSTVASTQAPTTMSSTPDNNSNTTELIPTPTSNSSTTEEPISVTFSTAQTVPVTTEIATPTPALTITDGTTTTLATPTTTPQIDTGENVTATTLIEGSGSMPTGIVALVTLLTFAVIAVLAYVSLMVWRRYLKYRHGNRELLVNNLEFDTNDLRHFEL